MTARGSGPAQFALDLPVREGMAREDFFVTGANRAPLRLMESWPEQFPRKPVLVLCGPPGCGKTHLAKIWRQRTGALHAGPEDILTENVPALLSKGHLVIEDMPGDTLDEVALFHLVNLARETQAAVLLTARDFPARWPIALPDLRSRLKAALVARIEEPDDALLRAVLVKLFTDRQIRVSEQAINYMLTRMERSLAAARELVRAIDARALAEKAEVTRAFIARVMRERAEGD